MNIRLFWIPLILAVALPCLAETEMTETDINSDVGAWHDIRITGGVNGTTGRLRYYQTEEYDGAVLTPYLAYIPEKKRILMQFNCNLTFGLSAKAIYPSYAMLMHSDDEGETWSRPRPPMPPGEDGLLPVTFGYGMNYHGDGYCTMYSLADNGAFNRLESRDFGETWTLRREEPHPEFGQIYGWDIEFYMPFPDGGGRLFGTGYALDKEKPFINYGLLRWSDDRGRTWTPWRLVPQWKLGNEVALACNAKGELIAAERTDRVDYAVDHVSSLEYTISSDMGESWSERREIQPSGRHHPSMVLLEDGRMVMTYVVRMGYPDTDDGKPIFGIEAVVSHDGGHTWDVGRKYILAVLVGNTGIRLANGDWYPLGRECFAPQSTSTIYLPEKKKLLTAFGTCHRATGGTKGMSPRIIGLLEWLPEEK